MNYANAFKMHCPFFNIPFDNVIFGSGFCLQSVVNWNSKIGKLEGVGVIEVFNVWTNNVYYMWAALQILLLMSEKQLT